MWDGVSTSVCVCYLAVWDLVVGGVCACFCSSSLGAVCASVCTALVAGTQTQSLYHLHIFVSSTEIIQSNVD